MKTYPILFSAMAVAVAAKLPAATSVQTVNFDFTDTYDVGGGSFQHVDSTFFTGTFDPFDSNLGTLESYVFEWNLSAGLDGVIGGGGGSIMLSLGASFFFGGISFGGDGGSATDGGGPGSLVAFSVPLTATNTFLVSQANVSYPPGILALVVGGSPFEVRYGSPLTVEVSGSGVFDVTAAGSLTLTYQYTSAAVPEPSAYAAIFGGLALTGAVVRRRRRAA